MMKLLKGISFLAILGVSVPTLADNNGLPSVPYVIVDGESTIETAPDYVTLTFDIGETKDTTSAAAAYVNDQTQKLIALAMKDGVAKDDVRAANVNVREDFSYSSGAQVLKGVNVERSVTVKMSDLSKYSEFMKVLLDEGIVGLDDVMFDTTQRDVLSQRAMDQAIDAAHMKADAAAKHAGAVVDKVYALSVGDHGAYLGRGFPLGLPRDFSENATAELGGHPTVFLIPKSISVTSAVTIVYTLK